MGRKFPNPPPPLTKKGKTMEEKPYLADKDLEDLDMIKCPNCQGVHFRHAGNILTYRTYTRDDKRGVGSIKEGDVDTSSNLVYICIKCGTPWVMIYQTMFDASEHVDVAKFDRVNKALQKDTKTDAHC